MHGASARTRRRGRSAVVSGGGRAARALLNGNVMLSRRAVLAAMCGLGLWRCDGGDVDLFDCDGGSAPPPGVATSPSFCAQNAEDAIVCDDFDASAEPALEAAIGAWDREEMGGTVSLAHVSD